MDIQFLRRSCALLAAALLGMAALPACQSTTQAQPQALASEVSVKPGINESWKSSDIEPLIGRLETESREIYTERGSIGAVVGPRTGSVVAERSPAWACVGNAIDKMKRTAMTIAPNTGRTRRSVIVGSVFEKWGIDFDVRSHPRCCIVVRLP